MKNWKSNLFVILLVCFMLVCGFMLGRMNFDSDSEEDNQYVTEDGNVITNDDKNDSDDNGETEDSNENIDNNQNSDLNDTGDNKINSSNDFMSLFVGKYSYEKIYDELDADCNKSYSNLELKKDGTYTYSYAEACGGGGSAKGNYAVSSNKVYLYNDNCKFVAIDNECVEPNCSTLIGLDYELVDGEVKINKGNIELIKK